MAYFECVVGGGGTSLIIQITTSETSLYGQTITISKSGSTVGTTTFDNTGYAEYTVREAGQYTVTCQGYSSIVDVSNEFPVEIVATKTITVTIYSAANDTVSFTDATGAKTATTNSSGVASNIRITFRESSPTVTFTSSVAKNPSNLSQNYSRSVSLTTSTTEVAVMPVARSKVLYWWGYKGSNLEVVNTENGWSRNGMSLNSPTFNVNNISCTSSNSSNSQNVGLKTSAYGINNLYVIATGVTASNGNYGYMILNNTKTWSTTSAIKSEYITGITQTKYTFSCEQATANSYLFVGAGWSMACTLHAIWTD